MIIRITQRALDYIEDNKWKFENTKPHVGDEWTVIRLITYPVACNGEPVVELENRDKEWMRIPAKYFRLSDIVGNIEF